MAQVRGRVDVVQVNGRPGVRRRSPVRAAVWSLLTVSVYGFWWWWDLNRQLRVLGQQARPWRALGQVTLSWLAVYPALLGNWPWMLVALSPIPVGMSLLSVRQTATMVAAAQRAHGTSRAVRVPLTVAIAATALGGAVAWVALSLLALPAGMLFGVLWPLVAMVFVAYLQAGFNDAVGGAQ